MATSGRYLYSWFGLSLPFTQHGIVLAQTFVAMPFLVVTVEGAFRTADRGLEEAAATLGAARLRIFSRVTLPLVVPSLVAGSVLCWARALGEFGATVLFGGNTPGTTQTMTTPGAGRVPEPARGRGRAEPAAHAARRRDPGRAAGQVAASDRQFMTLSFAASVALDEFSLDVAVEAAAGEVVAVLGPNGAGKSTLLRSIAGLLAVDSGRVELDGTVLDDPARRVFVPPEHRRIGVVFQDHRLFPHLRVLDNVAFGLRSRGVARGPARAAAAQWLGRLDLAELARRRPGQLSGGQAQRVALARALACEPAALLLDEPLAALDVQTRAEVQGELREHLAGFAGPTLLVTHDPVEALLLAARIVVLERGRVAQQGAPAEITSRPATPYVARLVGMNLYAGRAAGGAVALDGGGTLAVPDAADGRVLVALRPSALTVYTQEPHESSARNLWPATITALAPLGDRIRITAAWEQTVFADVTPRPWPSSAWLPARRCGSAPRPPTSSPTRRRSAADPWQAERRARHHRAVLGRGPARCRARRGNGVGRHRSATCATSSAPGPN